jgi:mRNA-degrading endonuclease RelE of RelBE toxin-antitoxin system
MNFKTEATPNFARELKPLAKKYPSLKKEIRELAKKLQQDPASGIPLGKNCYKIRLGIASKGKGKSGGARIITYVVIDKETVFLVSIYDKSEQGDIDETDLQNILKHLP